jgi:ferredoxin--NADP+ reductase
MPPILSKKTLAPAIHEIEVEAPRIARQRQAGQFVILRVHDKGERFPLTIVGSDVDRGTITLIFQETGKSTAHLAKLGVGDDIPDLAGPLGQPTHVANYGTVACVGGGIGVAEILPVAVAMKEAGNRVISIIGARSRDLVILEDDLRRTSDRLEVTTDDGSYGRAGLVTDVLRELIEGGEKIDLVVAVGPVPMMRAVVKVTDSPRIRTFVSLNPIMLDGTGMCGACRVTVGGETKFACVDGPDFDGHEVDFDELVQRQRIFRDHERVSMEHYCRTCAEEAEGRS